MNLYRLSAMCLTTALMACSGPTTPTTSVETVSADVAIETPTPPETGYSDEWNRVDYWSGEYPNAPAIMREDIVVMALPNIARDAPGTLPCPLPHKAVYSPWNGARTESDQLQFVTLTYPTKVTLQETVELETFQGDTPTTLTLSEGDTLIYENYLSEGWFIASLDGREYELNESELPQSTVFEQGPDDDQWLRLTCADADASQAWVRYADLLKVPGIEPYNYTSYGDAADLP